MHRVATSADGLPIHYDVIYYEGPQDDAQGVGVPALVFIHGWSCDRSYWRQQMDEFAAQYTVVAIDLGGHGDSGLDRDAWTMAAFGQDVVAVVEQLNLEQVVLVGHSMGGTVCVEAAQQMPARVRGIVGVDTFKRLGHIRTAAEIEQGMNPVRHDFAQATDALVRANMFTPASDPGLVDRIARDMAAAPPHVAIDAAERLFGNDAKLQAGLRRLQVPVSLINSDFVPTHKAASERFGINVALMSGVGHFVMLQDPAAFNVRLGKAVKSILATPVAYPDPPRAE